MSEAETAEAVAEVEPAPTLPDGEYAIVEIMGHRTLVGRITEIERFGTKMMAMETVYQDGLLPTVMVGGASIFQITPCSRETAALRQPRDIWSLPTSIRAALPPEMLPAPEPVSEIEDELGDEY